MDKLDEVKEWINKAEADFEGAMHLARRRKKPLPDLVCFHCQQCAEKYLNPYSVQFRYPGEESDIEEAKLALATLKKIRKMMREYFSDDTIK